MKYLFLKLFGRKVNNVGYYENKRDRSEDSKEEVGYVLEVFGKTFFCYER